MKADNHRKGRGLALALVAAGWVVLTILSLDIRTAGAQGSSSIRAACDPADSAVVILANTRQGTDSTAPAYWPHTLYVWASAGTTPAPAVGDPIPLGPGQQARIPWPVEVDQLFTVSWATGIAPNGVWWPADTITPLHGRHCGDPDLVDQTTSTSTVSTTHSTISSPQSTAPDTTVAPTTTVGTAGQPQSPFPPTAAAEPAVPTPSALPATGPAHPARNPRQLAATGLLGGVGLGLTLSIPATRYLRKVRP